MNKIISTSKCLYSIEFTCEIQMEGEKNLQIVYFFFQYLLFANNTNWKYDCSAQNALVVSIELLDDAIIDENRFTREKT